MTLVLYVLVGMAAAAALGVTVVGFLVLLRYVLDVEESG